MNIGAIRTATFLAALTLVWGAGSGSAQSGVGRGIGQEPEPTAAETERRPAGTGEARPGDPEARPARPAWAAGDVPDTVWILVETSVETREEDEAKTILRSAEELARRSLVGHEESVGRRFALAVVLGMRTEREGGKTKVGVAGELYRELEAVLALDPEHPRARHLMGRLHAGVRRMNGITRWIATRLLGGDLLSEASWAEAERHLAFAEAYAPEVPDHHLQLALLYRETGRPDMAATEAAHVLELEASSPLERAARAEAVKLLEERGGG